MQLNTKKYNQVVYSDRQRLASLSVDIEGSEPESVMSKTVKKLVRLLNSLEQPQSL